MLQKAESSRSSRLKINEIWLLILRMLMLALLVLIIAEPRIKKHTVNSPITYYVEESLLTDKQIKSLADSLAVYERVKLLNEEFSEYEPEMDVTENFITPNYWQLAEKLQYEPADSIVVFSRGFLKGIKGKRPELVKQINWVVMDPGDSVQKPILATVKGDYFEITSVKSDAERLHFSKELFDKNDPEIDIGEAGDSLVFKDHDKLQITDQKPLEIQIYFDDSLRNQSKYIHSSLKAISKYLDREITVNLTEENSGAVDADVLIWLSGKDIPDFNGKQILFRPDDLAGDILVNGSTPDEYFLTDELNSENIISEYFTEKLLNLVLANGQIPEIAEFDNRTVEANFIKTSYSKNSEVDKVRLETDLSKYLWIILVLSILAERAVAKIRKQ